MLIDPRRMPAADVRGRPLYGGQACAALDRQVIAAGTPGFELMQQAAMAAWRALQQQWPDLRRISVCCGGGNNGGDGLLVALHALRAGWQVRLWLAVDPASYSHEAAAAWAEVQASGLLPETQDLAEAAFAADEVLVDALLGIGLQGEVRGQMADWIDRINQAPGPVFALDVPSGLQVDDGQHGVAVIRADLTLTFIALKPGLFTGRGPDVCGQVLLADLGIQPLDWPVAGCGWLQAPATQSLLPPRRASSHKVTHGRLLVIGGLYGMGGAALLAAQAALRAGAGMVRVLTAAEHVTAFLTRQPEIMVEALQADLYRQLEQAFEWADVLLIGPGLGQTRQARNLWQASWNFSGPQLVDADALNLWAAGGVPPFNPQRVITPHPGEAARLLGVGVAEIESDRLAAARKLQQISSATLVLKGAGSVVMGSQQQPVICPFGNPGMAVAGMGDLLSGCIAALLAQGLDAFEATTAGVYLHARAGDEAAGDVPRGLIPGDLLPFIRKGVN